MGRSREVRLPERHTRGAPVGVGIEGVNTVIFSRDEYDIVRALRRNGHILQIQRLSVGHSVQDYGKQLAEVRGIDVRGRQGGLIRILTGPPNVIMLGRNADLSE
jgi:hypothetical protein